MALRVKGVAISDFELRNEEAKGKGQRAKSEEPIHARNITRQGWYYSSSPR